MSTENKYPEDVKAIFEKAEKISIALKAKLQEPATPKLADLFLPKGNKIYQHPDIFTLLQVQKQPKIQGLYVFGEITRHGVIPKYVGISRNIIQRLRQHGWGKIHNHCTLAYLMARADHPGKKTRTAFDPGLFDQYKNCIKQYKVVIYKEDVDYNLYFYEVILAGIFQTPWNNFRTH